MTCWEMPGSGSRMNLKRKEGRKSMFSEEDLTLIQQMVNTTTKLQSLQGKTGVSVTECRMSTTHCLSTDE